MELFCLYGCGALKLSEIGRFLGAHLLINIFSFVEGVEGNRRIYFWVAKVRSDVPGALAFLAYSFSSTLGNATS